jgi:hypothetical protein
VTVSDGNGGGNYNVNYVANTTSTINPASLTVDTSNVTKTYDGTLTANGTATAVSGMLYHNVSNNGVQDALSGGTFAFTNANAGTADKTITVGGVTVNDGNSGGNYVVTYVDNTTSTINPASLTFVGTVAGKTYDATTTATLSGYTLTGFIGNQTVDAGAGAANFLDPNAGVIKPVTISDITLANGTNGGLASNYVVNATAAATATITPATLTVSATVENRVYNGTTSAALENYGLFGFIGDQTVTGVGGTASFANKNVGNDLPVTISGIVLVNGANGGLASNYVVSPNATSNADITPATLQVAGVVALNKVYDGTATADLDTQGTVLTGVFAGDNVQVGSITGNFLTKNVGENLAIVTGGLSLTGTDAMDYTIVQPSGMTASITPRPLTVTATGLGKVYDGTTAATVTLTDNAIAGDSLTVTSTNAFLSKDVGSGKYVNVSNITLGGTDAEDYTLADGSASSYANITPAVLTVVASGVNKVYDGSTSATVALSDSPLAGDVVDLTYSSAGFSNKNAGNGKMVTVSGITTAGADAGDYAVNTVATTTANITPATLTVSAMGGSKFYDGNTVATVTLADNAYAGDQVLITDSGASFVTPTVGNGKSIAVNGIRIAGGTDGGDYVLGDTNTFTTGDITGASVNIEGATQDATLPPAVPQPVSFSVPTAPPAVMDLTLPAHFVLFASPASGSAPATSAANLGTANTGGTATVGGGIEVSLVQPAGGTVAGTVSVSVPQDIAASGQGFSFALPPELRAAAALSSVHVTWRGKRLPSWLRYEKASRMFTATALPPEALPMELSIRIGEQRWTMTIAQR